MKKQKSDFKIGAYPEWCPQRQQKSMIIPSTGLIIGSINMRMPCIRDDDYPKSRFEIIPFKHGFKR